MKDKAQPGLPREASQTVFIGSSTEDIALADAVFAELDDAFEPTVWDQDLFAPSSYILEGLEQAISEFDYAVLILGPNDERTSRGKTASIPRDNVIAELGLFMGALGRRNVFVLTPRDEAVTLPTDFLGLTTLKYRQRPDGNNRAAVRTACISIKRNILRRGADLAKTGPQLLESIWPLGVALISRDASSTARLARQLKTYEPIAHVHTFDREDAAKEAITAGHIDAMFVDIFSLGPEIGIDLIAYVRDRHREIGVALYGTFKEMYKLPGVSQTWRGTLQHYWRMPKDAGDEAFAVTVEDMVLLFFIYRLSSGKFGEQPGAVALAMMRPEVTGMWPIWRHFL